MPSAKRDRWSPDELHVWLEDRLRAEGRDDLADVLVACRVPFELKCLCCSDTATVNKGCGKRWCPVCGPKVTARRYRRVARIAPRMQWPLAVMLSMVNPREVVGCIKKLAAAFKGFRKTKFWKTCVKGGFVGFEITHTGNGAHVHLHCLIDCEWLAVGTPKWSRHLSATQKKRLCELAQLELRAAWAGYLGQSDAVVWVRRADKKALAETIKYPFKPADFVKLKCSISEVIDEIDAGRRIASFGNCHATSKIFLGREDEVPRVRLCKKCKGDRTIFPKIQADLWSARPEFTPASAIKAQCLVYRPGTTPLDTSDLMQLPDGKWVTHDEWDEIMSYDDE